MSDKVQCPVCGEMVDTDQIDYLENGNIACVNCVENEKNALDDIKD